MLPIAHHVSGKMIPPRLISVLHNLEKIYGGQLVIESMDHAEVNFYVRNLTDSQLISHMMSQTAAIFGGSGGFSGAGCVLGPADFQILTEEIATAESDGGIWLRYLPNIPNRHDYLSGFWFY